MAWQNTGLSARPTNAVCVVRLASDLFCSANADHFPNKTWNTTADVDTHSMYHYNQGAGSYIQIPFTGRWIVHLHTVWYAFGGSDPAKGIPFSTSVSCNGVTAPYFIHEANQNGYENLQCDYENFYHGLLNAGDQIRVNYWAQYAGTVAAGGTANCTHMVVRYTGPN